MPGFLFDAYMTVNLGDTPMYMYLCMYKWHHTWMYVDVHAGYWFKYQWVSDWVLECSLSATDGSAFGLAGDWGLEIR